MSAANPEPACAGEKPRQPASVASKEGWLGDPRGDPDVFSGAPKLRGRPASFGAPEFSLLQVIVVFWVLALELRVTWGFDITIHAGGLR